MTDVTPLVGDEPEFAAFAAIDWADQKHFWRLVPAGNSRPEQGELPNKPEAVEAWAANLAVRFAGRKIAVALEQARGGLVYMLWKYAHLVLYLVPPTTSAGYRATFYCSGAASDPGDAALLLELLIQHRPRLRRIEPDTVATRRLQLLAEHRRKLVEERKRQANRLTDVLKAYYPQVLQWFDDVDAPLTCAFLKRWPRLDKVRSAHPGTLRRFFQEHNCRSQKRIAQRIEGIQQAVDAVIDEAILEAGERQALNWIGLIETLSAQIEQLDQRLAELFSEHPESYLYAGLPGAGKTLAPRLLAAFGTRRDRFKTAAELQCLSGIAPVTERSGKTKWIHFRWAASKFLRQTFHEFALHSLGKCEWARAYYKFQTEQHRKPREVAIRALAFKWVRILFRCWKDGKPYDEQTYLDCLTKRNSPLSSNLGSATNVKWKTESGFQKLFADFA